MGIPEDPVTGSAHSVLGPYWSSLLGGKGRQLTAQGPGTPPVTPLRARQCSPRGGDVLVRVVGQGSEGRVVLAGSAVVVFSGTLRL